MISEALRAKRQAICVEHMTHENAHRFDEAIAKFAHASYEPEPRDGLRARLAPRSRG